MIVRHGSYPTTSSIQDTINNNTRTIVRIHKKYNRWLSGFVEGRPTVDATHIMKEIAYVSVLFTQ